MLEITGGKSIIHCSCISTWKTQKHGPVALYTWHLSEVTHIFESKQWHGDRIKGYEICLYWEFKLTENNHLSIIIKIDLFV